MAERYERWLVAKTNVFAPGSASIAKLIARLQKDGFVGELSKGHGVKTVDAGANGKEPLPAVIGADWLDGPGRDEMRLVWTFSGEEEGIHYPLSAKPSGRAPFALEIHRAPEYVYPTSKDIDPLDATCNCGEDLTFEWDPEEVSAAFPNATGIFAECEECSRTFDPSKETATLRNPFDEDDEDEVPGGAAYRFALKVDCGDAFVADPKLAFSPALVALVEEEFGRGFYEFGALTRSK